MKNLDFLVKELVTQPSETTWLEFKSNNYNPEMIGKDICALANAAALIGKDNAYMLWGIQDETHDIVGTDLSQYSKLVGNEEIESWLRRLLSPNADFEFHSVEIEGKNIVVLIIFRALNQPVTFEKKSYIRIGSYTKPLNDYPSIQAQLWDRIRSANFESLIARKDVQESEILSYLDFVNYFDLTQVSMPANQQAILHYMTEEGIIVKLDNGLYSITNLGAILFAKRLSDFPSLSRKAIRVVSYEGDDRVKILKEFSGNKGYVLGFENLMQFLEGLLPAEEQITGAVRKTKSTYPMTAIREAVANALIHQDFSITGSGPLVEVFKSRLEITNPGIPLVQIDRIIDNPPRSRNEKLASLMRRLRMCEELGSGWDRMTIACESFLLPAPKIILYEESTRVVLFSRIPYTDIPQEDKIWSCYLHACIKQVSGKGITNSSLRERFGLPGTSSASVSRLIKEAVIKKNIKPQDPTTAPRHMTYIPYWA